MPRLPITEFEARIRVWLTPLGFVRRHGFYVLPIDDNRFGWLGLNRGTHGGILRVNPNIGVGHDAIAGLVESGRPHPPKTPRYPMPVILAPLYTLLDGAPLAWTFLPGEDVEPKVRDLAAVIGSVAVPFMHRFTTLDEFIEGMRARLVTESVDYDLPATLTLAGRKDEAEIELRRGLDKRVGIEGEWAESYRRFAEFLIPGIRATPGASPIAREPSWIRTSREALGNDLRAFGETELAARSADLTDAEMRQIGIRASEIATTPDRERTVGILLAKALAMAAVEVIEGQPRDLRRRRRDLRGGS